MVLLYSSVIDPAASQDNVRQIDANWLVIFVDPPKSISGEGADVTTILAANQVRYWY